MKKLKGISQNELFDFLEEKHDLYNRASFIESDPISIPHCYSKKEDIEIAGFLTATIAWGQRITIIKNAKKLMHLMDNSPHEFILNAKEKDLKTFNSFKHRTFNSIDCVYFIRSLKNIYNNHKGLQDVFQKEDEMKQNIIHFHQCFFELPHPFRTKKHVSNPNMGSAAKRINMFLRWMIRKDKRAVDFGIWNTKSNAATLYCPLDVHSGRVARKLGLLDRTQNDWKAVEELSNKLKQFDANDPIKYDFSLFGLGVFEKF